MKLPMSIPEMKSNEPNIALMNQALNVLDGLQREIETQLLTTAILEKYTTLQLDPIKINSFLAKHGFSLDELLTFEGFEWELSYGNINTPERATALYSFLLHEILLIGSVVRAQPIQTKKSITRLVDMMALAHLQMLHPEKRQDSTSCVSSRSTNISKLARRFAIEISLLLSSTRQTTSRRDNLRSTQLTAPSAISVSPVQEQYLDQQKALIEFLIMAYIFKAKDILVTFLLGYAQNPKLFDRQRPFVVQKGIDG